MPTIPSPHYCIIKVSFLNFNWKNTDSNDSENSQCERATDLMLDSLLQNINSIFLFTIIASLFGMRNDSNSCIYINVRSIIQ